MIELEQRRPAGISRNRFCKLMAMSRGKLYYQPAGESKENLKIMEEIDKFFMDHPTTGVLKMRDYLSLIGFNVNIKRVRRLMRKMGLQAIYPQRCLSQGGSAKYVHPYLLKDTNINHPNQVWSTDISYIPMKNGFMYMYAMIDVCSRYIVGWRLCNTLSASNCLDLVGECISRHGKPEIINSDQGCQYTSSQWEKLLQSHGIRISMDGRGRCKDNIWIERFWRSLKQEYIYLNPEDNVNNLRNGVARYIEYYNYTRPHQSLDGIVPATRYFQVGQKNIPACETDYVSLQP